MYRVMVVDDEPLVRTAIRSLADWSAHGFLVDLEARNGEQALTLLRKNPDVAIILLDIVMPAMDGIELLRRMRSEGLRARVIVLSAHDEYNLVREAFKAGADDYILKTKLEADSLLALLKAAARRGSSAEKDTTVSVVREEMQLAKEELLRSVLRDKPPADLQSRLTALGVPAQAQALLSLVWLNDLEGIRFRYRDAPSGFFQSALLNTMRQVQDRFGPGEVVPLEDDEIAVVLFAQEVDADGSAGGALLDEIEANVRHYLDTEIAVQLGRPVDRMELLGGEYRRISAYRTSASRVVVRARRCIKEGYTDPGLGLSELSLKLGVSRGYLSSEFRKETGKTLTDYILETRMDAARQLLLTTDRKVYEISEEVGYRNVEHFCRLFRKVTGCPPGSFGRRSDPRATS